MRQEDGVVIMALVMAVSAAIVVAWWLGTYAGAPPFVQVAGGVVAFGATLRWA